MTVFPEKIADHVDAVADTQRLNLRNKSPVGKRPVGRCQSGIVAGHQGAGDDEQKSCAGDQQRETMQTPIHFTSNCRLPIANCRLSIVDCRSQILSNRKSAIGNRNSHQCRPNMGNSSAGIISRPGLDPAVAASPKEKSAFAVPFAGTVTVIGFSVPVAPPSCHATTV